MSDETLNKLGNYFIYFQVGQRYNITFERFIKLVELGTWKDLVK